MTSHEKKQEIKVGMQVLISHDMGLEFGRIESINYKSGKVLVYFDYKACPHFASFNLDQIQHFEFIS
jgi:hypothetical protein